MGRNRTLWCRTGRKRAELAKAALFLAVGLGLMLVQSTVATAQTDVRREIECLALTIYFEARGEPDVGKRAVGHVVKNRAEHPLFPERICEVVKQGGEKVAFRCQFSWWCDGASDKPDDDRSWQRSRALARSIFWDYSQDPTEGALWYHADYVEPAWGMALRRGPQIGRHVFYGLDDSEKGEELQRRGGGPELEPIGLRGRF